MTQNDHRADFMNAVCREIDHAYAKHGSDQWGKHEFYAVLAEEVEELWEAIRKDEPRENVVAEMVQVAAMCLRYYETGDRYNGQHPSVAMHRVYMKEATRPKPTCSATCCPTLMGQLLNDLCRLGLIPPKEPV